MSKSKGLPEGYRWGWVHGRLRHVWHGETMIAEMSRRVGTVWSVRAVKANGKLGHPIATGTKRECEQAVAEWLRKEAK